MHPTTSHEMIYGINPVLEALQGGRKAYELFVSGASTDRRLQKILLLAKEQDIPTRQRDRNDLRRLCGTEHHQGVVLRTESFPYAETEAIIDRWRERGGSGLILVLDCIQDPHNLGALIRTAACAGADGVIIAKDRAVGVTPVVEKASAGAVATLPVAQVGNISQTLDLLKTHGFWVYGAAGGEGESLYGSDLTGNVVLVIGSEGEGLRPLVKKKCDLLLSIPLAGGVSSLNASVAGGVLLFEAVRQRAVER